MNRLKIKNPIFIFIPIMMLIGLILSSCSNDGDDDETLYKSLIATEWTMDDGTYLVFNSDGTGFEKPSKNSSSSTPLTWTINNNILTITIDDDIEVLIISSLKSTEMILTNEDGDNITLRTTKPVNIDNNTNEDSFKYDKALIGEWWEGDVLGTLTKRFFCPNGKGYTINSKRGNDYGVYYNSFQWEINDDGSLSISSSGSSKSTLYTYEISGKNMVLTSVAYNFKYEYRNMGSTVDESFDTKKPPFANYLKNTSTGYYYEIVKVTSGCNHASSTGGNMNEQFLHFFGSNEQLTTTGLRIIYYTPSWEGIDSYWASGTYTMSSPSGAYKYSAMGYCNGSSINLYAGAKLKISRSGSTTTYDFSDDNVELHVAVSK